MRGVFPINPLTPSAIAARPSSQIRLWTSSITFTIPALHHGNTQVNCLCIPGRPIWQVSGRGNREIAGDWLPGREPRGDASAEFTAETGPAPQRGAPRADLSDRAGADRLARLDGVGRARRVAQLDELGRTQLLERRSVEHAGDRVGQARPDASHVAANPLDTVR